jgi:hypothetical protein
VTSARLSGRLGAAAGPADRGLVDASFEPVGLVHRDALRNAITPSATASGSALNRHCSWPEPSPWSPGIACIVLPLVL